MAKKQPTIDTCVLSGKPIRQKDLDDKLVIPNGRGKAFIKAVQDTVQNPPTNPVVFSAKEISTATFTYTRHHFPARVMVKGRSYKTFPEFIYIQNQMFKLHSSKLIQEFDKPKDFIDTKIEIGIVIYQRTRERPVPKEELDKEESK